MFEMKIAKKILLISQTWEEVSGALKPSQVKHCNGASRRASYKWCRWAISAAFMLCLLIKYGMHKICITWFGNECSSFISFGNVLTNGLTSEQFPKWWYYIEWNYEKKERRPSLKHIYRICSHTYHCDRLYFRINFPIRFYPFWLLNVNINRRGSMCTLWFVWWTSAYFVTLNRCWITNDGANRNHGQVHQIDSLGRAHEHDRRDFVLNQYFYCAKIRHNLIIN